MVVVSGGRCMQQARLRQTVWDHHRKAVAMLYAAFIWTKWDSEADLDPTEFGRYQEFNEATSVAGVRNGGLALHPIDVATTVRLRDDDVLITDGPFLESKEHLSGFYLFECANLDEATAWAARIPGAAHGAIELRPVLVEHT